LKASIVIPSYNFLELLKTTLKSLENQTVSKDNFEVVVVDDCSSDGTADFLKNYKELNLTYIVNTINSGRAVSRNNGIKTASNELIILLDADIEVNSNFIELHLKAHENRTCAVIGKVQYSPDFKKNLLMKYLDTRGENKTESGSKLPGKYFRTANVSIPKDLLLQAGLFDESITFGGEDIELGFKLKKITNIYYLPEAIGYHRHYRVLDESMELVKNIGEYTLPGIFKKYPDFREEMHLGRNVNNIFYKLACSAPVYYSLRFLAKLGIAPYVVITYLYYRNYREGYLKYLRKIK